MNFAILTESKYFETTYLNVQQIKRYHPKSRIDIGVISLTDQQLDILEEFGCIFHDFTGCEYEPEIHKMLLKPVFVAKLDMPVCFMDADAVLMKPMDLEPQGDITVTVRDSKYGKVNSGVFIATNKDVINYWVVKSEELAKSTGDRLSEQNALNWMYYKIDINYHEVPCDIYNYPKIENGIPDNVVVAHLKSGRYKDPKMIDIVRCNI